jgi:hypothetical protein
MSDATTEVSWRRPRFTRAESPPSFQITERDVEIVRHVARHRFLRSTHISALLDAPYKKILERLSLLYHGGYLDRPRAQIEYHVRGGGSASFIYALGNRGARLLHARDGCGPADINWTHKNRESGREFILHTLAIADFGVLLTSACQTHGAVKLRHAEMLLQCCPPETCSAPRPWAWRVNVQHEGVFTEVGVVPDLVFALTLPDGRRRAFFVECDRGTMPLERRTLNQTSMLRKFLAYEATRRQDLHTKRFNWKAFRTLIVTKNQERATNMRVLIEHTPALRASPTFLFSDHLMLPPVSILGKAWLDATGNSRSLI